MVELKSYIRDIQNFPKEGVVFKDITPLLKDPEAFAFAIEEMSKLAAQFNPQKIVAAEARGFIFAAPIAYNLKAGFVPIRKPGKLPYFTINEEYYLEYAKSKIEMHVDAIDPNERVVIVDDILATGGTSLAMAHLVEKLGGIVSGMVFLGELSFLEPRKNLRNYEVKALLTY
ncbi:adenine phosphoribosyltransferase [Athalassotoga saccharophila]|uniref:adenine phosphoribosyltransferase n=1 Tax=Athalassotoga saccharophila TaxID=1441386 RepID=UPI001379CF89|nr:adenine phosphoribosyltransferase [Athalassotoga saccharophila]BBJ27565.1 adenine phosphoribosyltransferase [Athalassotoga saccharophila]